MSKSKVNQLYENAWQYMTKKKRDELDWDENGKNTERTGL